LTKREPSRGEAAAWKQLRALSHEGFSFRREHALGSYVADFVCLRRRLIVEVDGGVHDFPGRAEQDAKRDAWLVSEGYRVLRFRDSEILSEANWLDKVRQALLSREEADYRNRKALPLEGGGLGGGEDRSAQFPASSALRSHPTSLPPPPLGAEGRRAPREDG
jgi:very-short-patch-repair endonuclease